MKESKYQDPKGYAPIIDRVEMGGEYNATATDVRAFLWERLQGLGERPYVKGWVLHSKLHNDTGTHALKVTQRGRSVWVRGSLSKWSGDTEDGRPVLPTGRAMQVVTDILNRLGLSPKMVKINSIETGIDVEVGGTCFDYTPYLRVAKGLKRDYIQGERSTHYQANTRHTFKVYDKGAESGLPIPDGRTLLRFEHTHQNGASSIGKALGLGYPLYASELGDGATIYTLIQQLLAMIQEVLPTGAPRSTGALKDVPLETAIRLIQNAYGDEGIPRYLEALEEQALATPDKVKRKRLRDEAKKLRERYSEIDTERWDKLREGIRQSVPDEQD